MKYTYEKITNELNASIVLKRTDETGEIWWIPMDEGNSDYQRYLNPEAEQSTPSVIDEAEAK
jgi:uncharacterized protein involved in tolerance to divalent cations